MDVLGGDFLAYDWVRRQINFVFFLAALALVYIANSYYAEDMSRKIDDLNRELKELHYEYISAKSELMQQTKQSTIAKKLSKSGLKESVEPVRKIIIRKEDTP
jgi:cell division protein FtsL